MNRAFMLRVQNLSTWARSELGIAKMHHRQEFEYYCSWWLWRDRICKIMCIYSNNKCMCVFLISPVPITEPLTSELIDTPVFYNLAPRPIKYRVSVPIPRAGTEREAAITGAAGAPAETKEIINITTLPRHPALTNLSLSPPENVREEIKTNGLTSPTNRFLDALPQSAASLKEN